MTLKQKFWHLAVDWFEGSDGYTRGFAADQHWMYLVLWAAPMSALRNDQTHE